MNQPTNSLYSQIPAIDRLLKMPAITELINLHGQYIVVASLRELQEQARLHISKQQQFPDWHNNWAQKSAACIEQKLSLGLRSVINLTGTVLHTNLGRTLLAEQVIDAVAEVMRTPVTLEYDIDGAGRGHRDNNISELLCQLTGAEAACIVNNNAAAVLIMLAAMADQKEVIVSRGELVEIGGAFRIPDVMRQAGCYLKEVGTTNRTHLHDYRQAVSDKTALLMKVHTSNYSIEGFTKSVSEKELVQLGLELNIPVVTDLGSGSLIDLSQYGLPAEPMPQKLIAAGLDLVTFSGDKLLGGPQAGIIVGKKQWIDKIQRHPLKRALRVGKLTLAALDATLRLYLQPDKLTEKLPTIRLLTRSADEIKQIAQRILPPLQNKYTDKFIINIEECLSQIGSGSLPVDRLPSFAITLQAKDGRGSTLDALAEHWRNGKTPVISRIQDGKIWLDLRCVLDEQQLVKALA